MNGNSKNLIVQSSEYTPVYLVESPSVSQVKSIVGAQKIRTEKKPVSDSLKRFYENSGNLENNLTPNVNNVEHSTKPRILKRPSKPVAGNNLKLANFLLPKSSEVSSKQYVTSISNVVVKPVVSIPALSGIKVNNNNVVPISNNVVGISNNKVPISNKVSQLNTNVPVVNSIVPISNNIVPINNNIVPINNNKVPISINKVPISSNILPKSNNVALNSNTNPISNSVAAISNSVLVSSNSTVSTSAPVVSTTTLTNSNGTTIISMDRKLVKLDRFPHITRTHRKIPKIKPKEITKIQIQRNPPKLTSVQLLKLGETYHSLNQLDNDQMKMVNQALKMFRDPEKVPMEPTYDPVTNTRFIYKIVSPKDLTVVGKNKLILKEKDKEKPSKVIHVKPEPKRQYKQRYLKTEPVRTETPVVTETKVTRSGRKVKHPKQILPEESPQKVKKTTNIMTCVRCSAEFCSFYRLQRHYEHNPTHIPTKIHSNLFNCLLSIIKSATEEDMANVFIQQLEQLISKLKSLQPCFLKKMDGSEGKCCTISDDIGRFLGMDPGKYNINMDALDCFKDKDGYCKHNPAPPKNIQFNSDLSKPSQLWLSKHNEELANNESDTEICARTKSIDQWPTVSKRIWKIKNNKTQAVAKKIRVASENSETHIELGVEDLNNVNQEQSAIICPVNHSPKTSETVDELPKEDIPTPLLNPTDVICVPSTSDSFNPVVTTHSQFHSTHFDIRSSPMKPTSTVFQKFQISLDKMANYGVQVIAPLNLDSKSCYTDKNVVTTDCEQQIHSQQLFNTENKLAQTMPTTSQQATHIQSLFTDVNTELNQKPVDTTNTDSLNLHAIFRDSDIELAHKNILQDGSINIHKLLRDNSHKEGMETSSENSLQLPILDHMDLTSKESTDSQLQLQAIFRDSNIDIQCKTNDIINSDLNFDNAKNWTLASSDDRSHEGFIKSSSLMEPGLFNVREDSLDKHLQSNGINHGLSSSDNLLSTQGQSVLNFLDSLGSDCLAYPETEIRNNSDDLQLDLFTFSNT